MAPDDMWEVPNGPSTVEAALRGWAATTPERAALRHGREEWSFARLNDAVDHAAAKMVARSLRTGDRVVVVGDNSSAWVIAYLATMRAGAVVAPANNRLSAEQFRAQCAALDASLVLYDESHRELVAGLESMTTVVDSADLLKESAVATTGAVGEPHDGRVSPDDIALISFTSGTTGTPKGAVLTHRALLLSSAALAEALSTSSADSTLVLVPLFHNTGFVDQLGHMLVVGGCTNLLNRYRTADAVAEFRARPVSLIIAVPSILRLLMVADGADYVFSSARSVAFGGSPMPDAWSAELRRRWPAAQLVHGYGLSEFTSVCTLLPSELNASCGESVGLPARGVRLQVVDEHGRSVPVGETGEVWVAGAMRMREYWCRPDLTAEKLSGDWLRTGDLGHLDAHGLLWLDGRVDDVINRGGEKILPSHVESSIARLPGVSESTVFGVPDPVLQQRIVAAVQPRPGDAFDESAARAALLTQLPSYAVPEGWVVYGDLPRTASGKTDRQEVRRRFLTGAKDQ